MSVDFQLAFNCSHVIGEERVLLADDRRTLNTLVPIGGTGLLRLRYNDVYDAPASGVLTAATLTAAVPEPYAITDLTRELIVTTGGSQLTMTLPLGYLSALQVAAAVNAAASPPARAPARASVVGGYLQLQEAENRGSESQLRVTGRAAGVLGFGGQYGAQGHAVLPAWDLYRQTDPVMATFKGYLLRFRTPVRINPYWSLTYSTPQSQCLRCRGTGIENDVKFDSRGEPLVVEGANLLYQQCLKIILTELRSNIYYSWYGSLLKEAIGTKALAGAEQGIRQAVRQALTNLQNLQNAQANYQVLTAAERLYAVDAVDVNRSADDPTTYLVDVAVRSYSNEPLSITIVYAAPGTFALAGTNGLALGTL